MSEQKLYYHNEEVEELAGYESTEINIVPKMLD